MLKHLWTADDHEYLHERYRVQLAFMLQLFCYSGARAGAIVESSSYRGTNEAITYKVSKILSKNPKIQQTIY